MSDFQFQDRSTAAHGEPATLYGPDGVDTGGSVHQVVFRWDGNQGRQGTGMKAVAHSCSPERAEELGRELGPLLWVSGTAASRQSVVRTLSRDGDVMLVQRWLTTDRAGRPSTISHVLIGAPGTLKTRQCLGLSYGGWGSRESAEKAAGRLRGIESARLDAAARKRLPDMLKLLPTVKNALMLVTAEWLRDPRQRVSLLTEEKGQPGWPDQDAVPVVYLGLFLLFGSWLGQDWTFATYDTVDTHQLRLMCVPRWEPDAGGSGPLARVMGRRPSTPQFEHKAAAQLVNHLLAHPEADAGVPQLVDELGGGAELEWARRRVLLHEILSNDRRTGARTAASAHRPAEPDPASAQAPVPEGDQDQERAQATPAPPTRPYPYAYPDPGPAVSPPTAPPRPLQAPFQGVTEPGSGVPAAADEAPAVHRELCVHQREDLLQRSRLVTWLGTLPDELLLDELRSGELPPESVELLLDELGNDHRVQVRQTAMRHELCAEVLHNGLYFTSHGQGAEPVSRTAMAARAANLFTWAVAPLARDERYLRDLQELLHRMARDTHPTAGNWLWQSIIAPTNGRVPDLPPVLWQQILRDVISRNDRAPSAPQASHPAPALTTSPEPSTPAPQRPTLAARLSELANSPGCVMGAGFGVIAILITIVLIAL